MKRCGKCHIEKETVAFSKSNSTKDGLKAWCKECNKDYMRIYRSNPTNKIRGLEKNKIWRTNNKDKVKGYDGKYLLKHKDKIKEYRLKNKNKITAYNKKYHIENNREKKKLYYKENKEMLLERGKLWDKNHPSETKQRNRRYKNSLKGKINARNNETFRRMKKKGVKITELDIKRMYFQQDGKCFYCGIDILDYFELDHIIPITKGGEHKLYNLVLSCKSCNCSKRNKPPELFVERVLRRVI